MRDQGDKQLDLIDEINNNGNRKRRIGFNNEVLAKLEKEIRDKELEIRKNKRSKKEKDRNDSIFNYTATDGKEFDFTEEIKLLNFAEDLYKGNLTFDEAEKEQEEMF